MEKLCKKYHGNSVEESYSVMSAEAKGFVRDFKNALKREFAPYGAELIGFKPNHYDTSGFIKIGDRFVYVSYSIPRYDEKFDFYDRSMRNHVLYRTAESEKDYRGGGNHFCSLMELVDEILFLLRIEKIQKEQKEPAAIKKQTETKKEPEKKSSGISGQLSLFDLFAA